jgi:hypothetical protein
MRYWGAIHTSVLSLALSALSLVASALSPASSWCFSVVWVRPTYRAAYVLELRVPTLTCLSAETSLSSTTSCRSDWLADLIRQLDS